MHVDKAPLFRQYFSGQKCSFFKILLNYTVTRPFRALFPTARTSKSRRWSSWRRRADKQDSTVAVPYTATVTPCILGSVYNKMRSDFPAGNQRVSAWQKLAGMVPAPCIDGAVRFSDSAHFYVVSTPRRGLTQCMFGTAWNCPRRGTACRWRKLLSIPGYPLRTYRRWKRSR